MSFVEVDATECDYGRRTIKRTSLKRSKATKSLSIIEHQEVSRPDCKRTSLFALPPDLSQVLDRNLVQVSPFLSNAYLEIEVLHILS